jgi:hypothetical protein
VSEPLAVGRRLFAAFHAEGVRYCHWKSNEHVAAGAAGDTDLDILIDRRYAGPAQRLLAGCGFKRFDATPGMGYPAIEDHIAMDRDTGRLLHCHVHYRLVAGERHLKGYRMPWEDHFLDRRRWDEANQLFVADPDLELLTLIVRFAVKLRTRDLLAHGLGRSYLRGGLAVEYQWLRARADVAEGQRLCSELLGGRAAEAYGRLLAGGLTLDRLTRFRRAARPELDRLRIYAPLTAVGLQWGRTLAWLAAGLNRRYFHLAQPLRRTVPTGGVLVALMGSDGSGKSTLRAELRRTLGSKVDVAEIYFGSGDGPSSLLRWPLRQVRRSVDSLRRRSRRAVPGIAREGKTMGLALAVWALVLAREKRQRLRRSWRARNRGMVVLADRYPQAQVMGFNDGPLLSHLAEHPSRLLRWVARREAAVYRWADRHPPDLVVRLLVSPEVAVARKPEMTIEEVTRRTGAVRSLSYPCGTAVVDVDADRPLAEVRRAVHWAVWGQL